jgi:hypothetical protein
VNSVVSVASLASSLAIAAPVASAKPITPVAAETSTTLLPDLIEGFVRARA